MPMTNIFTPTDIMDLESLDITVATNTPDTAIVTIGDHEVIITHHQDHYMYDCDTYQTKQSLLESIYAEHLVLEASQC